MNNNGEPEWDPSVETDYSAEEAEEMGAFVEDARESIEDFESENDQRRICLLARHAAIVASVASGRRGNHWAEDTGFLQGLCEREGDVDQERRGGYSFSDVTHKAKSRVKPR
jgi:hypothetical protein